MKTNGPKKAGAKKADAKKADAKKADAKKADAKKADAKKAGAKKADARKADARKTSAAVPVEPFDQHFDLPASYGRAHATLMLKNPEWMFLHWDLDGPTGAKLTGGPGYPSLRVLRDGTEVHRCGVDLELKRYYVRVPEGGGQIRVELGREHYGEFTAVLSSAEVEAPVVRVSSNLQVNLGAPEWTGTGPSSGKGAQVLSEGDFRSFFGDVRNDLPWYRTSR